MCVTDALLTITDPEKKMDKVTTHRFTVAGYDALEGKCGYLFIILELNLLIIHVVRLTVAQPHTDTFNIGLIIAIVLFVACPLAIVIYVQYPEKRTHFEQETQRIMNEIKNLPEADECIIEVHEMEDALFQVKMGYPAKVTPLPSRRKSCWDDIDVKSYRVNRCLLDKKEEMV